MRAGKLRNRIELQRVTRGKNRLGESIDDWKTFSIVYASIDPIAGSEPFIGGQTRADVTHKVTVRWVAGLTAKDRIKYGSRIFDIDAVLNPEERNEELTLLCHEAAV
jgi:SPP1 family predicted phage head-tail adaptor